MEVDGLGVLKVDAGPAEFFDGEVGEFNVPGIGDVDGAGDAVGR